MSSFVLKCAAVFLVAVLPLAGQSLPAKSEGQPRMINAEKLKSAAGRKSVLVFMRDGTMIEGRILASGPREVELQERAKFGSSKIATGSIDRVVLPPRLPRWANALGSAALAAALPLGTKDQGTKGTKGTKGTA